MPVEDIHFAGLDMTELIDMEIDMMPEIEAGAEAEAGCMTGMH